MSEQGEPQPREQLYNLGWRQGALFFCGEDQALCYHVNKLGQSNETVRKVGADQPLLLISHDCDIANDAYPYLEALICDVEDLNRSKGVTRINRITLDDPRNFLVSREHGWIAQTKYRVLIQKNMVDVLPPPSFQLADGSDFGRFRVWLAQRYSRPANDGQIHQLVFGTLSQAMRRIREELPDDYYGYVLLVHETRINLQVMEDDQVGVGLLVILKNPDEEDIQGSALEGVEQVIGALSEALKQERRIVFRAPQLVLVDELLYVDYMRTDPWPTDWASLEQGNRVGSDTLEVMRQS